MLQCPNKLRPTGEAVMGVDLLNIEGLKDLEHQGPIVMVNRMWLARWRRQRLGCYLRYSAL
jgi:hypothetical protein